MTGWRHDKLRLNIDGAHKKRVNAFPGQWQEGTGEFHSWVRLGVIEREIASLFILCKNRGKAGSSPDTEDWAISWGNCPFRWLRGRHGSKVLKWQEENTLGSCGLRVETLDLGTGAGRTGKGLTGKEVRSRTSLGRQVGPHSVEHFSWAVAAKFTASLWRKFYYFSAFIDKPR